MIARRMRRLKRQGIVMLAVEVRGVDAVEMWEASLYRERAVDGSSLPTTGQYDWRRVVFARGYSPGDALAQLERKVRGS